VQKPTVVRAKHARGETGSQKEEHIGPAEAALSNAPAVASQGPLLATAAFDPDVPHALAEHTDAGPDGNDWHRRALGLQFLQPGSVDSDRPR
jgi:hypothetical protein